MRTVYDTKEQAKHVAQGLNVNEIMVEETEYRWTYLAEPYAERYIIAAYDEKGRFVNYL